MLNHHRAGRKTLLFTIFLISSLILRRFLNFSSQIHNVWVLRFVIIDFSASHTRWCKQVIKKGWACLVIKLCQTSVCWQEKHFWKSKETLKIFLSALKKNLCCTSVFQATQTEIISDMEIAQEGMSFYTFVEALKSKCSTDSLHYKSMLQDKL